MLMSYTLWMKKSSRTSLIDARYLHSTYDRGSLLFKSIFVCMMTIYECKFFYVHILTLVFLPLKLYLDCLIYQKKI